MLSCELFILYTSCKIYYNIAITKTSLIFSSLYWCFNIITRTFEFLCTPKLLLGVLQRRSCDVITCARHFVYFQLSAQPLSINFGNTTSWMLISRIPYAKCQKKILVNKPATNLTSVVHRLHDPQMSKILE